VGGQFEYIRYAYQNQLSVASNNVIETLWGDHASDIPPEFFATSEDYFDAAYDFLECPSILVCASALAEIALIHILVQLCSGRAVFWLADRENCPSYFYEQTPDQAAELLLAQAFYPDQGW